MPKYVSSKIIESTDIKCTNIQTDTVTIKNMTFDDRNIKNLHDISMHSKDYYLTGREDGVSREEFDIIKKKIDEISLKNDSLNEDVKSIITDFYSKSSEIEKLHELIIKCDEDILNVEKQIPNNLIKIVYLMGLKIHTIQKDLNDIKKSVAPKFDSTGKQVP